ncbi:MAG: hypothetical protein AAF732_00165 [Pseudomonadota bacterium]
MIDLSRVVDTLGGLFGQSGATEAAQRLFEQGPELNINFEQLQGLDPQEIVSQLAEQGIDLSSFDATQLTELSEKLGTDLPIEDILSRFTDRAA